MRNVTVRLEEDLITELEEEADEEGVSRSEYIRNTLRTRDEHGVTQDEHERLRDERERLQADLERCEARLDQCMSRIEQRMPNKDEVHAIKKYQEKSALTRLKERLF